LDEVEEEVEGCWREKRREMGARSPRWSKEAGLEEEVEAIGSSGGDETGAVSMQVPTWELRFCDVPTPSSQNTEAED